MTITGDSAIQTQQREVQQLLGKCLLRLQQCERLIKAIVAHHKISGPVHALEAVATARISDAARKTLGTLVGDILGSYVVSTEIAPHLEDNTNLSEEGPALGVRVHVALSIADFARTEIELKELVSLRNSLVHHFIDQHDLWSVEGCRSARDALITAYSRIDQHFGQLRGWTEDLKQLRKLIAEFVQSDMFRDLLVNGIAPDGTVNWPAAGVVSALREAAEVLAVNGWAPVGVAGEWISERYPEQLPEKYGCRSWRQVVHESRIFELRYDETGGQRAAWYREKMAAAKAG